MKKTLIFLSVFILSTGSALAWPNCNQNAQQNLSGCPSRDTILAKINNSPAGTYSDNRTDGPGGTVGNMTGGRAFIDGRITAMEFNCLHRNGNVFNTGFTPLAVNRSRPCLPAAVASAPPVTQPAPQAVTPQVIQPAPIVMPIIQPIAPINTQVPAANPLARAQELRGELDALGDPTRWQTLDGNFNWVRLGTMALGGAIVGTAAGVLTNRLVANSQINRGQENIQCVFGGGTQTVTFGTTFMVQ